MKRIIDQVKREKEQLAAGNFFSWLSHAEPNDIEKLRFIPGMYAYVMGFRDLLAIIEGKADSEFQQAINAYVGEDASHFSWYVEDLEKVLRMLGLLEINPLDLWDQRLLPSRRAIYKMIGYAMAHQDVMLRIILILIFESTGEVFLQNTRKLVGRLGLDEELSYFGTKHYEDELAHTVKMDELAKFSLTEEQYHIGTELVEKAFEEYRGLFQSWLHWGTESQKSHRKLFDGLQYSGVVSALMG